MKQPPAGATAEGLDIDRRTNVYQILPRLANGGDAMTEIEGEVLSSTVAVLPPDVGTRVESLRSLDGESQAKAVTVMMSNARTGLLAAIASQDLPGIVEYKAKAAAIQEISKQLRLGKEMQLDAAEFVRRAERGLGVAIREGQANGTVARRGQGAGVPPGARSRSDHDLVKPTDLATQNELTGVKTKDPNSFRAGIYSITDDVSDEQFEAAIADAKAEANLSRANVARKAKEKTDGRFISQDELDELNAPAEKPKASGGKRFDSDRIVRETSIALEGLVMGVDLADLTSINRAELEPFIASIHDSLRTLNRFSKGLRNV